MEKEQDLFSLPATAGAFEAIRRTFRLVLPFFPEWVVSHIGAAGAVREARSDLTCIVSVPLRKGARAMRVCGGMF